MVRALCDRTNGVLLKTGTKRIALFTKTQSGPLEANCQAQIVRMDNGETDIDFKPVVKLFTPDAQCTWLLTELGNDDIAFGLRDLGHGTSELGFVSMREIPELALVSARRARPTLRRR